MKGDILIYKKLEELNIQFKYFEHPPIPTIELAKIHKKGIDATHCKNIFLRNHKGSKHFFVILEQSKDVNIRQLELLLKQGKLSFASEKRLKKYLNLKPGSVSPLSLVNDLENNTHIFIDTQLQNVEKMSFHPGIDSASIVIPNEGLINFLNNIGNSFEYIDLTIS